MTKLLVLSSAILLGGCSTLGNLFSRPAVPQVAPVEIVTIREPAPMYHPPLPESVNPAEVEWIVLNPSVMREYISNYDEGNAPAVAYYAITTQGYTNLSQTMGEIQRWIRQSLNIIKYYRDNDPMRDQEEE